MIDALLEARASHRAVAPPSEQGPLTLERAYAIQDTLREGLVKRGERVIGWKISGSISSLLRPGAGDIVSARFTRLGSVSARFV